MKWGKRLAYIFVGILIVVVYLLYNSDFYYQYLFVAELGKGNDIRYSVEPSYPIYSSIVVPLALYAGKKVVDFLFDYLGEKIFKRAN